MEAVSPPSLRRRRTSTSRKPRTKLHLCFEVEKANGLQTSHQVRLQTADQHNARKTWTPSGKAILSQHISIPKNDYRREHMVNDSNHVHRTNKGPSKADAIAGSETSETSRKGDGRRVVYIEQDDCLDATMEAFNENSDGSANGSSFDKELFSVSSSIHSNDLTRQSSDNKTSYKPSLPKHIQSYKRRIAPKKAGKDKDSTQKDSSGSAGGLDRNFTRVLQHPSDSRRDQYNVFAEEIVSRRAFKEHFGEESLGEDTACCLNDQSTSESEQHTLVNSGSENGGLLNETGRGELQVHMVRKSSRVPKKRILDGNEEAPLKRQRKKLETQLPEEEFSDPAVLGEPANEHCEKEASELVHDNQCLNRFCEKERLKSNKITGHFQDEKKTLPLTARQRALKISKEGGDPEANCTSFSDASQPVSSKRQKEYLTDAEQAIKKEEAARRRKQQIEKNAKEIQAVAIQKILGQESSRKKREEKQQKQRQEIEKEKQAAAMAPAVNSIRWVMGPSGNMVSFSRDVELPKIFSGPCSYPREREKCAGPSCNNVYRYRDSKTRLPLCSLQCYKAVQGLPSTGPAF